MAPCSAERNHLGNFGRWPYEEQFQEIILNLNKWFKSRCHYPDISYLQLWPPSCLAEGNHLDNFSREHHDISVKLF